MKTQNQIETALLNVDFTHLGARDFKTRGSPSGKEILSHVAVGKIIKETRKEKTKCDTEPLQNRQSTGVFSPEQA